MRAIELNPTDSDLYQALGVLRYMDNELIEAEDSFRNAILLNQTSAAL